MKVTDKTGSGKTTFVSAFIEFLIDYIEGGNIYLLFPLRVLRVYVYYFQQVIKMGGTK